MPLEQRVITPIFVSRGCFSLDNGSPNAHQIVSVPNELECVTNGTLANIIRQLSSLSRFAEDLFGSILEDTALLVQRSATLKQRLDTLADRVERLDSTTDSGSLSNGGTNSTLSRKPFRSRADNFDQQVVSRQTIPLSLREVYSQCDAPPPLDKLNPFRDDNMNGLKLYTNPNYFFELWRKEMLSQDRSRNKVAKKGDNAHMTSNAKTKRNKQQGATALRHQNSIQSSDISMSTSSASPSHHHQQQQHYHQHGTMHMHLVQQTGTSQAPPPPPPPSQQYAPQQIYTENGVLLQQQHQIYGQTGAVPQGSAIYGYHSQHNAHQQAVQSQQQQSNIVMMNTVKREESNPSGHVSYTVIEGSYVDPNNYQHHYVQYHPNNNQQAQSSSRPNSLELSHQQQQQQQHQQQYSGQDQVDQYSHYGQYGQRGSISSGSGYGSGGIYSQQGGQYNQHQSPSQSQLGTPTRRIVSGQLSRPSAPPPAPPTSSQPNSQPSTPSHKIKGSVEGGMLANAIANNIASRDSLPPPPPPPPGATGAVMHHMLPNGGVPSGNDSSEALPPPPPPPPPPPSSISATGGQIRCNGNQNDVCSPPPPPPPPMPNGPAMSGNNAQFKPMTSTANSSTAQQQQSSTPTGAQMMTAEMLQAVKLKKTTPASSNQTTPAGDFTDTRSNLMAAIRQGIKLKRVEESRARETEKQAPLHDVASILARRVAMEMSDSEGEGQDDDDDSDAWDDESEC